MTFISNAFKLLISCSIIKTIYFNFKVLPFQRAIKIPFFIGKKVRLRRIGKINLTYTGKKKIHIGTVLMFNTSSNMETIWENNGQITIEGPLICLL